MKNVHIIKSSFVAVFLAASVTMAFAAEQADFTSDPRGSIANSTSLSDEQKAQLLQTYDKANGEAVPACGSIICLSGEMGLSECKGPINDYFKIKKKKNGHFSPSRTLKARTSYLNTCKAPDAKGDKARINAKFGMIPNSPF